MKISLILFFCFLLAFGQAMQSSLRRRGESGGSGEAIPYKGNARDEVYWPPIDGALLSGFGPNPDAETRVQSTETDEAVVRGDDEEEGMPQAAILPVYRARRNRLCEFVRECADGVCKIVSSAYSICLPKVSESGSTDYDADVSDSSGDSASTGESVEGETPDVPIFSINPVDGSFSTYSRRHGYQWYP